MTAYVDANFQSYESRYLANEPLKTRLEIKSRRISLFFVLTSNVPHHDMLDHSVHPSLLGVVGQMAASADRTK